MLIRREKIARAEKKVTIAKKRVKKKGINKIWSVEHGRRKDGMFACLVFLTWMDKFS